jgi:hypothetical protein
MDGGPEPTNPDGSLYELRNIAYLNATNTTEIPVSELDTGTFRIF